MAAHSKIGASSYSRWSKTHGGCPGSVRLSEGLKSIESEYAREGTNAHEFAAFALERHFYGTSKRIPHYEVTDDMREATKIYVDFIVSEAALANAVVDHNHILIEHRFDLGEVYPGLFGTADAVIYDAEKKKLIVIDYKHGQGLAVEVEDNLQLQYYGLGALLSTGYPCETVELVIVQPRCEHTDGKIRRWSFESWRILDFAADLAIDAKATEDENAPLNPGKHCRFCPAAAVKCTAIKNQAQALAKIEFKENLSYDPEQLDKALTFLPAIEAWVKQVREFAYAEAMHGRTPPGWKLVEKRGTRKWKKSDREVIDFMCLAQPGMNESEFYETPKIKSPAQMEKLNNKHVNEQLRSEFIETVSSGYNLVPESDPRPAIKLDAKTEFTQIEGD